VDYRSRPSYKAKEHGGVFGNVPLHWSKGTKEVNGYGKLLLKLGRELLVMCRRMTSLQRGALSCI
jgi:hypothetical protein